MLPPRAIQKTDFESAVELPSFCIRMAKKLEEDPHFSFGASQKSMIAFESVEEPTICGIFNVNTEKLLEKDTSWKIGYVESLSARSFLVLLQTNKHQRCSLETLERTYYAIFQKLITNWQIDPKGSGRNAVESDFSLFIKNNNHALEREVFLINQIADLLSINDKSRSNDKSKKNLICDVNREGNICLKIRKTALRKVVDKLGFPLNKAPSASQHTLYDHICATKLFMTIVLLCDGYLAFKNDQKGKLGEKQLKAEHFFKIVQGLPMDPQMMISNRLRGITNNIILVRYFNIAFKAWDIL